MLDSVVSVPCRNKEINANAAKQALHEYLQLIQTGKFTTPAFPLRVVNTYVETMSFLPKRKRSIYTDSLLTYINPVKTILLQSITPSIPQLGSGDDLLHNCNYVENILKKINRQSHYKKQIEILKKTAPLINEDELQVMLGNIFDAYNIEQKILALLRPFGTDTEFYKGIYAKYKMNLKELGMDVKLRQIIEDEFLEIEKAYGRNSIQFEDAILDYALQYNRLSFLFRAEEAQQTYNLILQANQIAARNLGFSSYIYYKTLKDLADIDFKNKKYEEARIKYNEIDSLYQIYEEDWIVEFNKHDIFGRIFPRKKGDGAGLKHNRAYLSLLAGDVETAFVLAPTNPYIICANHKYEQLKNYCDSIYNLSRKRIIYDYINPYIIGYDSFFQKGIFKLIHLSKTFPISLLPQTTVISLNWL